MGFINLHHRAAALLFLHAVEESVAKRNIYLFLFQFSSGCFPVVDMHASKHAKKLPKAELSIQLRQIITSFDKPFSLRDGRLLFGQYNNNSDDVCLFCLTWQPRPLYLQRLKKMDVSTHCYVI